MRRFLMVILSLLTIVSIGLSFLSIKNQKDAGISAIRGYIDGDVRRHIVAEYGDATSIEDLLEQLKDFACENFKYNYHQADIQHFQWFDYMHFVQGTTIYGGGPYSGICFDFSAYTSAVVQIISEYKDWNGIRVDMVRLLPLKGGSRHSCNFIYADNAVYYLDLTADSTEYQQGRMDGVWGAVMLGNQTPKEFCRTLGYVLECVI